MKTLSILTMAFMFALATLQMQAQDLAKLKEAKKETKKELKMERKELRTLEGKLVDAKSKTNFVSDFGNLPNVVWKRTKYFDEATFLKDGQKAVAYYDFESNLVGTTFIKKFADLPVKSQNEIKSRYKDYIVNEVLLFDDNEKNQTDMVLWGSQFDDADNYFVVLSKAQDKIIVRVDGGGFVYLFKKL
jgi:hypothetical protein